MGRLSQEISPEGVCQMYDLLLPNAETLTEIGKEKQLNRSLEWISTSGFQ
jgi:hypothetical protein